MQSLRGTIKTDPNTRQVPTYQTGSLKSLAHALKMTFPASISTLIADLNNLPFATRTFDIGQATAQSLSATIRLGIQSNGAASFIGWLQNGSLLGQNWLCTAMLTNVKDSTGSPLLFVEKGYLDSGHVSLVIGGRSTQFQQNAQSELIATQWDVARTSPVEYKLAVSVEPWGVLASALTGIGITAPTVVASSQANLTCRWSTNFDSEESVDAAMLTQCPLGDPD